MKAERKFFEKLSILINEDKELSKLLQHIITEDDTLYRIYYKNFEIIDGDIWFKDECTHECIATNRTPEQCYIFLRSIIL